MDRETILEKTRALEAEGDNAANRDELMDIISSGNIDPVDVFSDANGRRWAKYIKAIELLESIVSESSPMSDKKYLLTLYDKAIRSCGYNDISRSQLSEKKEKLGFMIKHE